MYQSGRLILQNSLRTGFRYRGPITTVIGDWSGTFADKGSLAPKKAVQQTFSFFGVDLSVEEAGAPMGVRKDEHVRQIFKIPRVKTMWVDEHKRLPDDTDISMVYDHLVTTQLKILPSYTSVIPGVVDTVRHLKKDRGIKVGLTTGFTKAMSDILAKSASKQGLVLDCIVAGDEVVNGSRPYPNMLYKNMCLLGTENIHSVVKVDDTVAGIKEGLNAGCWTVGVRRWSTYTNYNSIEQMDQASSEEIAMRALVAGEKLYKSGAHFVVNDVTELPQVIDKINNLLKEGVHPDEC
ncbi:hypothetical protein YASMINEVIRUS_229 [Yasminevirus sp. GU-2018]|uniref:Phosphonoacetaldehyde hydrolase n=1 Tax=Yasminevirus sp. GU-2018 TaxID=2420051 RepID=A0A5K0U9F7_9VIRU|nr:hypothetical protein YASMINEVIRUS_229 [Yasminevirus sp. GU-2018]